MIVDASGNTISKYCHHSLRNIPDPASLASENLVMMPIPVPCMGEQCVNWDLERSKCGDVSTRELLAQLLEKQDA